jgi:hypothetical protein
LKTTIATTVAALLIAAVSFGATVAPASAAMMAKHPAHWGMRQVCKTTWDHHHHKHTVCTWVKKH